MDYPNVNQIIVTAAAEKLMEETMARYDPSHDALHVKRVRKTALSIARDPRIARKQPDLLVIELAAFLHDVLDKKYVSAEMAADPYAFFLPFFQSVSAHIDLVASGQAALIVKIVENVSWTTEKKLRDTGKLEQWHDECVELHCVQDADRLDAIGAIGIMRCAAYSAVINRPLVVPQTDREYDHSSIAHFHDKLLHIKSKLKTEPGRKLGEKRHRLMLDFLDAAKEEIMVQ